MRNARTAAFAKLSGWIVACAWTCVHAKSSDLPVSAAQSSPPPLEVIVLGSGGPGALDRASSSYVVLIDGSPRFLVDAGSGAFVRIGEAKLALDALPGTPTWAAFC
jgi:hypothetical protein